jgi:hypothetical protein
MKRVLLVLFSAVAAAGVTLIVIGLKRYGLPYENDRYFDAATAIVYQRQAAELYLGAGVLLTMLGASFLIPLIRRWRSKTPVER